VLDKQTWYDIMELFKKAPQKKRFKTFFEKLKKVLDKQNLIAYYVKCSQKSTAKKVLKRI